MSGAFHRKLFLLGCFRLSVLNAIILLPMGFLSDIVIGAISKGVNKPTFVFINVALIGCVLLLVSLVFGGDTPPDVLPHLVVLIFFALGLLGSVNWLISQVGTVSAEEQQKELFPDEQAQEEKKTE